MIKPRLFLISRKNRGVLKSAQIEVTGPWATSGRIPGTLGLPHCAQLTAQAGGEPLQHANKRGKQTLPFVPILLF